MKVLFVYPNITKEEGISPGIAYLSGYLKQQGHIIDLVDFTWTNKIKSGIIKIERFKPDIIGFTSTTMDFDFAVSIANEIKKEFDIPIIFGGAHPTSAPDETITQQSIDMICNGEGELAFAELLENIEKGKNIENVKNIWIKKNDEIIKNPVRPLIENLDLLICDREIFDFQKYLKSRGYIVDIYAGRGCPYRCTYCINPYLQTLYKGKGKYTRLRSVENIIREIQNLQERYTIKGIAFPDDTFTYNKKWLIDFCDQFTEKVNIPFICNARIENIDNQICKILKKANCNAIMFGVESGSENIRKNILNRDVSDDTIIEAFNQAKQYKIKTFAYNMIGIPYENKDDIEKTIKLNQRIKPDEIQCTIFYPFRGTELYNVCKKNGWILDNKINDYSLDSILKYDQISVEEIKKVRERFGFNVFYEYNFIKAVRSLLIGKYYNTYIKLRGSTPLIIRQLIHRIANTFYY